MEVDGSKSPLAAYGARSRCGTGLDSSEVEIVRLRALAAVLGVLALPPPSKTRGHSPRFWKGSYSRGRSPRATHPA